MRRRVHYCHCSSEKGCRRLRAPEQQVVECTFELQVERAASTPQYTGYAGYARYSVQVGYWRNMGLRIAVPPSWRQLSGLKTGWNRVGR